MPRIRYARAYPRKDGRRRRQCSGLLDVLRALARHELVPLPRKERLLLRVAILAGGHRVPTHGASAADQRDDVIHREGLGAHLPSAVVTGAYGDASPPPCALT